MYAVIETGGKQYRVEVGTELEVELLEAEAGASLTMDRVLLVADGENASIGRPLVTNGSVAAEVIRRDRGPKLINFKYGPKTRRRVKKGHRQELTILRISDIVLDGKSAAAEQAEVEKARKAERDRLAETARKQAAADAELAAKLAAEKASKAEKAPKTKAAAAKAAPGKDAAKAGKTTDKATAKAAPRTSDKTAAKADTAPKAARTSPKADKTTKPAAKRGTTKKDT
jgi:large subunit ribosomal protein L21